MNKKVIFSVVGATTLLFIAMIFIYPKYQYQSSLRQFDKADEYIIAVEPSLMNASSDEEIYKYLDEKIYFYEFLYDEAPDKIVLLEEHNKEATTSFLRSLFVDPLKSLSRMSNSTQFKTIHWLNNLQKVTTSMHYDFNKFPDRYINEREAELTLSEVITALKNTNEFSDRITNKIIQFAIKHRFEPTSGSFLYYPRGEELEERNQLALATIRFYRLLHNQGVSKSANTIRYISLHRHIN